MRRLLYFLLVFLLLFSLSYAQEIGKLEFNTEVNSNYGQDFSLSYEKWWSDNLGIGANLAYNSLSTDFSYKFLLQTPYIKTLLGTFYPGLNLLTNSLALKGYQLGIYIVNDEIYYISGKGSRIFDYSSSSKHSSLDIPIQAMGWYRAFTKNIFANFSLLSFQPQPSEEYYSLDIMLADRTALPLGNLILTQEVNVLLKNSYLYLSTIVNGELSMGSMGIKAFLGYLHPENLSFCPLEPGDLGGEISLSIPISSNIFPEYSLGYFYNSFGKSKLDLGLKIQFLISNYINIESMIKYLYYFAGESTLNAKISFNFPALEGAMWNSIYVSFEKTNTVEDTSLGLNISYQF